MTTTAVTPATTVHVTRGRIASIGDPAGARAGVLDLEGLTLLPGFIDLHIHGAGGYDAHAGEIGRLAAWLPRVGVTAFLPTLAAGPRDRTLMALRAIQERRTAQRSAPPGTGAIVLGAHLEGPYLQPSHAGAIPAQYLRPVDARDAAELLGAAPGLVRVMTIAPDLPGALDLIGDITRAGIVASIGHTAADYELALRATGAGAAHVTHLFNAMPALHHRAPGLIGAALSDARITVELIADGEHVHPAVLAAAMRAKGPSSVALVSDAVGPAGLPPGRYTWLGREVVSDGATARLLDGTLAGSLGTLDMAVRVVTRRAGCSLVDAAAMAATVPARILGIPHKGRIAPGCDADITALDDAGSVRLTLIGGRIAYDSR